MLPFHLGTLNRRRSAPANRSNTRRAAAHASASAPCGAFPENTVVFARAPTAKSGNEPSHRSQCSILVFGWLSANAEVKTSAMCPGGLFTPFAPAGGRARE